MTRIVTTLQVNGIETFAKSLAKKTGARELLGQWADTYLEYVHARHRGQGYGSWPPLSDKTIRGPFLGRTAKRRGNIRVKKNPRMILLDTLQLLNVSAKNGRGQERKLDVRTMSARVGANRSTTYLDPRKGGRRKGGARESVTLSYLFQRHELADYPGAPGPRRVFVEPSSIVQKKMNQQAAEWVERVS